MFVADDNLRLQVVTAQGEWSIVNLQTYVNEAVGNVYLGDKLIALYYDPRYLSMYKPI